MLLVVGKFLLVSANSNILSALEPDRRVVSCTNAEQHDGMNAYRVLVNREFDLRVKLNRQPVFKFLITDLLLSWCE